ncbi:MAG: RNA 2',3'-cyclic phosphodiesterase [Methylococcaceae bacterium]|nr:RNA 2',3'-cyclic phosphodiesterase [Methylococcaceae bacterium]
MNFKQKSESSRLFLALWPDDVTRARLSDLSLSLRLKTSQLVSPHNFHVTLVFIGRVNKASELLIKQRVTDISSRSFTLIFNRISYWHKPKVICLTTLMADPHLMALAEKLNNTVIECGVQTDTRPFNPHITLARHVSTFDEHDCEPLVWKAESFCLVESCSEINGVNYKVRDRWSFENRNFL